MFWGYGFLPMMMRVNGVMVLDFVFNLDFAVVLAVWLWDSNLILELDFDWI